MVVELDHNIFFVTGEDTAQTELGVIDLRTLGEGGFAGHKGLDLLSERKLYN